MRHIILKTFTGPFVLMKMDDSSLRTSWMDAGVERLLKASRLDRGLRADLVDRLMRYFAGERVSFADVELAQSGPFQRRCWEACRRIPRGQTRSYAELAAMAKSPSAFRAAGQAMRRNQLPVIVPCHRVVGSNGTLHGFGGSVDAQSPELLVKRRLLEMEGALADERIPSRRPARRGRTLELISA